MKIQYFLRFTDTAEGDLERGTSINASDEGNHEILDGLCGYLLESETIEEAIEEVENGVYQFSFVGRPVIFKGVYSQDSSKVADGDCFNPISIEKEF